MVTTAGAAAGSGAVRPLNLPWPVRVKTDSQGWPEHLTMGREQIAVASIEDIWRILDEWWRDEQVSRTYFEVLLADGRRVTLFIDHATGQWHRQRYG